MLCNGKTYMHTEDKMHICVHIYLFMTAKVCAEYSAVDKMHICIIAHLRHLYPFHCGIYDYDG